MPTNKSTSKHINVTNISVISLEIKQINQNGLLIEPESGDIYDDSFLLKCTRPISIQKNKTLLLNSGFTVQAPQPIDSSDGINIITSPYHIEWKVEPNMDILTKYNIWAYGSSGSILNPEIKLILFNLGDGIFNAIRGTTIATLQFYLVPKLQIKKV